MKDVLAVSHYQYLLGGIKIVVYIPSEVFLAVFGGESVAADRLAEDVVQV
jgi:hypothetical protein